MLQWTLQSLAAPCPQPSTFQQVIRIWLVDNFCLSTCKHVPPTTIQNLVGEQPTWKSTLTPLASQGWVMVVWILPFATKKYIFENGLAFSDRDERVTQSTKSWKLHKVTHIINFILKENVKVQKGVSKFEGGGNKTRSTWVRIEQIHKSIIRKDKHNFDTMYRVVFGALVCQCSNLAQNAPTIGTWGICNRYGLCNPRMFILGLKSHHTQMSQLTYCHFQTIVPTVTSPQPTLILRQPYQKWKNQTL